MYVALGLGGKREAGASLPSRIQSGIKQEYRGRQYETGNERASYE